MKLAAILSLFLAAATAGAQPYLVKDLDAANGASASVTPVAATGGSLFLTASRADTGAELWRSDGTAAGTALLRDILPGGGSASPRVLGQIGETLFFAATDPDHGTELWRSNGTAEGTRLVADINPGPANSVGNPGPANSVGAEAVVFRGRLLFAVGSDVVPDSVWSSDGTAAGTVFLAKVKGANSFLQFGDRVVFGSASEGLWTTDGTADGTARVGSTGPFKAEALAVAGNRVLFAGTDLNVFSNGRRTLWWSDLTPEPTVLKRIIVTGRIVSLGNRVVFAGEDDHGTEPWVSDGTEQGTQMLRDIAPGSLTSMVGELAPLNGVVYFAASDQDHGRELWRTDGTAAGTLLVADIIPGFGSPFNLNTRLSVALGRIWMSINDGHGEALWTSDGTLGGTHLVARIAARSNVVEFRGRAYFEGTTGARTALYSTDGTSAGTTLAFDVDVQPSSYPSRLIPYGNHLYVSAGASWITDGSAAGTIKVTRPSFFAVAAAHRGSLYFDESSTLYRLDGSETPVPIKSLGGSIQQIWSSGGILFFNAAGGYISDGTAAGTVRVQHVPAPDAAVVAGHFIYPSGDRLQENNGGTERTIKVLPSATESPAALDLGGIHVVLRATAARVELWKSDGSADGTVIVTTFDGAKLRNLTSKTWAVAAAADLLYFALDDGVHGFELWRSDGTAAGTFRLAGTTLPRDFTPLDDRLLFTAEDEHFARTLWISDGTISGTHVRKDVAAISGLTVANGIAFFSADDGVHGAELWQSDGTAEGTFLVADVEPGPASSDPQNLAAADNLLYFTARAAGAGRELWALPLPTPRPAISIGDVRVTRLASTATLTVSLSAPAAAAVTADWAVDDARFSGSLAFAPGQVQKQIAVSLLPNNDLGGDRRVNVRLRNVRGATPVKSLGTVVIEQRLVADLAVELAPPAAANPAFGSRSIVVRNLGPSTAADVRLFFNGRPYWTLNEMQPGTIMTRSIQSEIFGVTVTAGELDPNLANNRTSASLASGVFGLSMSMEPGALAVGSHAKLLIVHRGTPAGDKVITLISSNPTVIALPASVTVNETTPATLDIVANAAGFTRLTAVGGFDIAAFDLTVSPAGAPPRWPSHLYALPGPFLPSPCPGKSSVSASVPYPAPGNGAIATGFVTFTEGSRTLAVAPLDDAGIAFGRYSFRSGRHEVTATYGGDANFLPSSDFTVVFSNYLPLVDSFSSAVRWIDDKTAELRVTVHAIDDLVPTGTLTVKSSGKTLVDRAPLVNGAIVAIVPLPPSTSSVTVVYNGDENYFGSECTVALIPARQRAVR